MGIAAAGIAAGAGGLAADAAVGERAQERRGFEGLHAEAGAGGRGGIGDAVDLVAEAIDEIGVARGERGGQSDEPLCEFGGGEWRGEFAHVTSMRVAPARRAFWNSSLKMSSRVPLKIRVTFEMASGETRVRSLVMVVMGVGPG